MTTSAQGCASADEQPSDDRREEPNPAPAVMDETNDPATTRDGRVTQARGLLAFFFAFSIVFVARIANGPGWPQSHDISAALGQTEIYAAHLRRWDLFPTWSTNDALGFGSPAPFYYHKVYAYLSAGFRLIGFSPKGAVAASLVVLMGVGLVLTYRCIAVLVDDRRLCALFAGIYVFSTYVITDILIRSSMAEFSWTMILPWFLGLWVVLMRDRRWSWQLGPAFLLLFFAHSGVTVATISILLIASLPSIVNNRFALIRDTWLRAVISIALVGLAMTPYLLTYRRLSAAYSPSAVINDNGWVPTLNYLSPVEYLWIPQWFRPPYVVNVGQLALVPIVVLIAWLLARRVSAGKRIHTFGMSIGIAAALPAFMQTRFSSPLYSLPVFRVIQFPWRLVALATLCVLIAAAAAIGSDKLNRRAAAGALVAATSITLATNPVFARTGPDHVQYEIGGMVDSSIDGELAYAREYLPKITSGVDSTATRAERLAADVGADYTRQDSCTLVISPFAFEAAHRDFTSSCDAAIVVALPVYSSPMHRVSVDGERVSVVEVADDPRLHVSLPPGDAVIRVDLP